ncbi:MAG: glycosyltransferase family 4 protein, partial [Bacteroidia bacterium]|nr:glycosyltransferase family 4 protein [Bacteroidia bacterium]
NSKRKGITKKMKILFILENYYPNIGGVETLFKNLSESLVKNGYEVTVLTNRFSNDLPLREDINGVKVIRTPLKNRYLFTLLAFFPAVKLAGKFDLIHTTSYNAAIPAFFAGLVRRKKTIITFHEVWGRLWFDLPFMSKTVLWLHYLFEKMLLKFPFYKFVAVSEYTKSRLVEEGIPKEKIRMIHNGIDYDDYPVRLNHENSGKFRFLYFGRLGISKGLDILLQSIDMLARERDDFEVVLIIPKTPVKFHNVILGHISRLNLDNHIIIKSELSADDLASEINSCDAVVVPSYSEGFCYSAVECMAMQVPLISSGGGALSEVVNGQHIQSASISPESFKDAMVKAMNNEWDYTERKSYHLHDSVDNYMKMYSQLELN